MKQRSNLVRFFRPSVEFLEDRVTPAIDLTMANDAFQITDINNQNSQLHHTWTTPAAVTTNLADLDHSLAASVTVRYDFSGQDALDVQQQGGFNKIINLWWLEMDGAVLPIWNDTVEVRSATFRFQLSFQQNQTTQTLTLRPTGWSTSVGADGGVAGNGVEYAMRLFQPGHLSSSGTSGEIWLQPGANAPLGGAAGGPRPSTQGVTYGNRAATQAMLNPGAGYDVYTVRSDANGYLIDGFNTSGHDLLNASDTELVIYEDGGEKTLELDPSTTFETVFESGTSAIGHWDGDSIIGALSHQSYVSGWTFSGVPSLLPEDGQTISLSPDDVPLGEDALWLSFHADGTGTIGFLLVPNIGSSGVGLGEGTIRGRAFDDADQDGIEEAGEVGVQSLFVFLYDQYDNLVAQTQTDANGDYQFDNIDEGTYYVVFEQPQDYAFTLQDQGSDDTIDSDADVNGITALFTLIGSEIVDDIDAGLYWAA